MPGWVWVGRCNEQLNYHNMPIKCFREVGLTVLVLFFNILVHATDTNILDFGAKGDSLTLNSAAIQRAIDACSKSGGGRVVFPPGKYLSGTIVLKNNVTLYLERNAAIVGSTNLNDYENIDPFNDGLGTAVGWALIAAVDVNNIGIDGLGVIDGQGSKLKEKQIVSDTRPEGQRWGRRPFLLRIVRCVGVTVRGVTLEHSAAWTSHYFQSRNILIEGIKIVSVGVPHNDGIDIDGSQHVRISSCDIVSGDDALCFKTTSSKMPCSDIVVRDMRLKSNQGAIKMGTESMAPFENIKISNCYIYDTNNGGIKLLTVDGAHLRNIEISEIEMHNVRTPMLFRLGSRLSVFRKGQDQQQSTGSFENVVIRNVKAQSATVTQLDPASGILISGVPGHDITNLTLENIQIELPGGGTMVNSRQQVPEAIDKYPEVKTFGPLVPAYGVWARHVKGLKLINLTFRLVSNDLRPAVVCEDGSDIVIASLKVPPPQGAEAIVRLENVRGAEISKLKVNGQAGSLIRVEGSKSREVHITGSKRSQGIEHVIENIADSKTGGT